MCDNQNFENENMDQTTDMDQITIMDINNLLVHFSKNTYCARADNTEGNNALQRCISLLKSDYNLITIDNSNGELCSHYPSQLPILEYENTSNQNVSYCITSQSTQRTTDTIYESIVDVEKIRELFNKAKYGRCRTRFPIPTILYKGKYICRSSTLSGGPEIYGRSGLDYLFYGNTDASSNSNLEDNMDINNEGDATSSQSDWQLFDKVRSQDIKLLKKLNVGTIVDLMVEKKKVKYGVYVTSSEKVDKENRYSDFNIIQLPYPGCEFFKDFRENNFNAKGLIFDWNRGQCDVVVSVPDNPLLNHIKIDWNDYKNWDLITITQNYIKYLLKYIQDNSSGILIHCISGWDRTPLFISLIRLSLWADGLVHQSLNEIQILYLTIAYDWMLFGHHLCDRLDKGEEIFFFCFYILKYLAKDEFSIAPGRYKLKKHTEKVSEESVNRTDNDTHMDDLEDQEMRGSSVSLNSISSNKSQDLNISFHQSEDSNGSTTSQGQSLDVYDMQLGASTSPQSKCTPPIMLSSSSRLKRTESPVLASSFHSTYSTVSSNSAGSWQVVTSTGSVRGSDSTTSSIIGGDIPFSNTSLCTVIDGDEWSSQDSCMPTPNRKDRLLKLRELFYQCYFSTIGTKNVRYRPEPSLGAILGNIAEKVVSLTQKNEQTE